MKNSIYKYSIVKKIKVIIGLILFIFLLSFCLNFYINHSMPDRYSKFDPSLDEKKLLVNIVLFPISIISILSLFFYIIEYFSIYQVSEDLIIKKKPFGSMTNINIKKINSLYIINIILLVKIKDGNNSIIVLPSLSQYKELMEFIYKKYKTNTAKEFDVNLENESKTFDNDTIDFEKESDTFSDSTEE